MTSKQYEALYKEWEKLVVDGRIPRDRWIQVALSTGDFDEELASLSFDSFDVDGNGYVIDSQTDMELVRRRGIGRQRICTTVQFLTRSLNMTFGCLHRVIDIEEYFTVAAVSMNGTMEQKMIGTPHPCQM